jgi:hypothetical protein
LWCPTTANDSFEGRHVRIRSGKLALTAKPASFEGKKTKGTKKTRFETMGLLASRPGLLANAKSLKSPQGVQERQISEGGHLARGVGHLATRDGGK